MLRISNKGMMLISQGYHFDENGKKFVRVFGGLGFIKIQIKIQKHKEMHILSANVDFPYNITDDWVEITTGWCEVYRDTNWIEDYIDKRCNEIWFV